MASVALMHRKEEARTPVKAAGGAGGNADSGGGGYGGGHDATPCAALKLLSSLASPQLKIFEMEQQKKAIVPKRKRVRSLLGRFSFVACV